MTTNITTTMIVTMIRGTIIPAAIAAALDTLDEVGGGNEGTVHIIVVVVVSVRITEGLTIE